MKLKKGFITQEIMGEQLMVAVGAEAKRFHGLVRSNETAAFLVDLLKQPTTKQALAARLLEAYEVDEETAKRDVHAILETLRGIGALED